MPGIVIYILQTYSFHSFNSPTPASFSQMRKTSNLPSLRKLVAGKIGIKTQAECSRAMLLLKALRNILQTLWNMDEINSRHPNQYLPLQFLRRKEVFFLSCCTPGRMKRAGMRWEEGSWRPVVNLRNSSNSTIFRKQYLQFTLGQWMPAWVFCSVQL